MSCVVRKNTIEYFIKQGAISSNMRILDNKLFDKLNNDLSNLARDKYSVTNTGKLFTRGYKDVPSMIPAPNNIAREGIMSVPKAIPNEDFFQELQQEHDIYHSDEAENESIEPIKIEDIQLASPVSPEVVEEPLTTADRVFDEMMEMSDTDKVKEAGLTLKDRMDRYLEKIGVRIQTVDEIRDKNGNLLPDARSKAKMLDRVIEVTNDTRALDDLPEEAAHFFVAMLGEGHPLYREMYNKITSYKIYEKTVEQYKNKPAFKNADGTPNYDMLKREAMGKLIAEHIINMDPGNETDQKLETAIKWWQKLWEYVKSIVQAEPNPFLDAATQIYLGNINNIDIQAPLQDEEYYSLVDPLQGLLNDQDNITFDDTVDARTGQKRHVYNYKGTAAKGSVTTYYVDRWLKKIFKTDSRSELQKIVDLLKAEFGDVIHDQIEDLINSYTNEDGTISETQSNITPRVPASVYKILDDLVVGIMAEYDPGTRFFSEVRIFDQKNNIGGTIDLLIVKQDGEVDMYDWKSQEIYFDQTDIKTYKEPMYRIQLENYRKILELQYGFKKFGKIRAIPIATKFAFAEGKPSEIKSIEVGSLDPTQIPEDKSYLLPVTLRTEATGDTKLDRLIEKLYGIYDKIDQAKFRGEELLARREELGQLRVAIRDLQLKGHFDKLIDLGLAEYKKYKDKLDSKTLTGKDIPEALSILQVFSDSGVTLLSMNQDMMKNVDADDKAAIKEAQETNIKFLEMATAVNALIEEVKEYRDEQAKVLGEKNGIMKILDPEKAVGTLKGLFASLSNITQKSFRLFSKMLRIAQNTRDVKFQQTADELIDLKKKFIDWASSKGISPEKAMEMMLQIDEKGNWNGNFVNVFQSEFYKLRDKALEDGDGDWLVDNMTYDDERFEEALVRQREFFNKIVYSAEEKENKRIINEKINDWIESNRVIDPDGKINIKALFNKSNRFLRANEKWHTQKWIDLNKPENRPAKEVYNYFQKLMRTSERMGMIDKYSSHFIPSVYASKLDQLVFGDVKNIFSTAGIFENLEVDSGSKYTPETDPVTGQVINRIPVYFTNDIGVQKEDGTVDYSKKSRDLFKVFGVWAAHMYNFEAMQSIEDDALLLVEVEKNKESLITDNFGNIATSGGKAQRTSEKKNDRNARLLEDFVNFYVYDRLNGRFNDKAVTVFGKEYSLLKSVNAAMRYFSLKTLGLNVISGTANFVGGTGNALFMAQKNVFFTKTTWARSMGLVAGNKKAQSALVYLNILQDGTERLMIDNLSLSSTNKLLKDDNLFVIQRMSDKAVQYPVAISMMINHMVEDGKIVDIQRFVKDKYNYNDNFYNLSAAEQKATRAKIDAEVKELQDKRSLLAIGKLDEKGKFSIPGIEKDSQALADFRSKIKGVSKKILGANNKEDINGIRTTLLGTALMQFRNWMPEMVEDRFGGLQYDPELDTWTYGKLNQFFGDLFSKRFPMLLKSIITGFGSNAVEMARDSYQRLRREAYEKGEAFDITEGEFIDMYLGNLKSTMTELGVLLAFATAIYSIPADSGDDDAETAGQKKYIARALKKYFSEFGFYYSPLEFTKLVNKPLPVIGLAEDMFRFVGAFSKEMAGQAFGVEEWSEKAKPMKYFFRLFPVAKEYVLMQATFDEDFRKDWDIQIDRGY